MLFLSCAGGPDRQVQLPDRFWMQKFRRPIYRFDDGVINSILAMKAMGLSHWAERTADSLSEGSQALRAGDRNERLS